MSNNYNQATKLAEIGAQLKQMREDKDISLNQVRATTLISERHLRAIEEGDLDLLPEPIYIQGFIRKYGSIVGLDQLAEEFPVVNPVLSQKWSGSPAAELRPLHLYLLYILVIAGAVSILATFLNPSSANKINDKATNLSKYALLNTEGSKNLNSIPRKNTEVYGPPAPSGNQTQPVINVPPAISASIEKTSEATAVTTSWVDINNLVKQSNFTSSFSFPANKPVNIGILMKGQSWVRVNVDGETKFEGVLSEGTRQTWSAEKDIVVRAGNAAAVTVTFNKQVALPMGADGEVAQQRFDLNYKPSSTSISSSHHSETRWLGNIFRDN